MPQSNPDLDKAKRQAAKSEGIALDERIWQYHPRDLSADETTLHKLCEAACQEVRPIQEPWTTSSKALWRKFKAERKRALLNSAREPLKDASSTVEPIYGGVITPSLSLSTDHDQI